MAFIKCSGGAGGSKLISDNITNLINNVFTNCWTQKNSNANTNTFSYTSHWYAGPITSSHISTYGLVKLIDTSVAVTTPAEYSLSGDISKYIAFIVQGRINDSSSDTSNNSILYPTTYALMTIPVSSTWAKEYYPFFATKTNRDSGYTTKFIFTANNKIKAFALSTTASKHGVVIYGVN